LHDPTFFLQNKVVCLPDLFFCHTRKLKSTEIIDKNNGRSCKTNWHRDCSAMMQNKFKVQLKPYKRKKGGSKQ